MSNLYPYWHQPRSYEHHFGGTLWIRYIKDSNGFLVGQYMFSYVREGYPIIGCNCRAHKNSHDGAVVYLERDVSPEEARAIADMRFTHE